MKAETLINRIILSCKVVVLWLVSLHISSLVADIKVIVKDQYITTYNKVFAIIKKIAGWIGSLGLYTMVKSIRGIWK